MARRPRSTLREHLAWAYANLAMAHSAVNSGAGRYVATHYMVRSRLYKGLTTGSMDVRSLLDDERVKMEYPAGCAYCGDASRLSLDHLIPSVRGGDDSADNVVWACSPCNGSKGGRDLMAWWAARHPDAFPPLLLLRRYLKLAFAWAERLGVLDQPLEGLGPLPFEPAAVPTRFPQPGSLRLWSTDGHGCGHGHG